MASGEEVAALDERLQSFLEPMLGFLSREDRRRWARTYVAGLLLDGERKSIQPLAARLGLAGDATQSLQQFVSTGPWPSELLQAAMTRTAAALWSRPHAWIKAGVPEALTYRSKNALALELVDEALARGLPSAPVLADSDYGDDYSWRAALRTRGVGYCVAVEPKAKAWTQAPVGSPPPAAGRPLPKDPLPVPERLDQIARALPPRAWRHVSWREGTRGCMQSRFARVPIWASHGYTQRQHQGARACEWLLVEWPADKDAPTDYWLAHLGAGTKTPTLKHLIGLARERWRVEQDYRELKDELGLVRLPG